jgi:hypothetical protein
MQRPCHFSIKIITLYQENNYKLDLISIRIHKNKNGRFYTTVFTLECRFYTTLFQKKVENFCLFHYHNQDNLNSPPVLRNRGEKTVPFKPFSSAEEKDAGGRGEF